MKLYMPSNQSQFPFSYWKTLNSVNENRALSQYRCRVIFMNPVKSDPWIENADINNRANFNRKTIENVATGQQFWEDWEDTSLVFF